MRVVINIIRVIFLNLLEWYEDKRDLHHAKKALKEYNRTGESVTLEELVKESEEEA